MMVREVAAFDQFVTASSDRLMEGGEVFRFVSFNIPNLHLVEDNMAFAERNPWRLPDRFEVEDALKSVRQAGGTVVRTYVLSVVRTNDPAGVPRHVLGPGRFNEEAFRALDLVLDVAHRTGVRVILPLVDNWSWWGGAAEYAGFLGKPKTAFWDDPAVLNEFKKTVAFVVQRVNTITGRRYGDDPAILGWETGNELESPDAWTRQVAVYLKSLGVRQLVIDGYHSTKIRDESLAMPEVDVVTTHHYPGGRESYAALIRENWEKAKGKKPYFVGEFGFVETKDMAATLDAVAETGTAGALLWSLRFRCRDGGFYSHSEPAGGNKYKAYHWPGFATGSEYDEMNLLALIRQRAYAIRGLPVPAVEVPAPPPLLRVTTPGQLTWQGSVGATSYRVERAAKRRGPWEGVWAESDETAVSHRPLFVDTTAKVGSWFYRVRAVNAAGASEPSRVVGPVSMRARVMVDEMADDRLWQARHGALSFRTREARQAKEDAHRLEAQAGSSVTYRVEGGLRSGQADVFFPKEVVDPRVLVSVDDREYREVRLSKETFDAGGGDYAYWRPARYRFELGKGKAGFVRFEFGATTQVGRIEMTYVD